jgi:hypothetical protein
MARDEVGSHDYDTAARRSAALTVRDATEHDG